MLALSVRDAGSEIPTLIIGTIPPALMLLGKPGGLRWRALLPGIVMTTGGLLLMVHAAGGLNNAGSGGPHFMRGLLLAAGAMASWTLFALGNAAWLRKNMQVEATDWANWLGVAASVGGAVLWLAAGPRVPQAVPRPGWWMFVAICVATGFGSAWLATVLWNMASTRLSARLCGQPVRPADRERNAVWLVLLVPVGPASAHADPACGLCVVYAGHRGLDSGASVMDAGPP